MQRPTLVELINTDTSKMSEEELRIHIARLKSIGKKDLRQIIADEAEGRPEHEGFLYILSHKAMPGLLKIGCTSRPVEKRSAEIGRATGVPGPFGIERKVPVYANPKKLEEKVHRALSFVREHNSREFFRISVEDAMPIIQAVLDGTFDPP